MTDRDPDTGHNPGLLTSLQRLMATLLELLQTRVEIVATEFEEERVRLRELVVFGILMLFFVSVGLTLATLFVVTLYWDTNRLAVLGGVAVFYLGLGGLAGVVLYRRLKCRSRLFATTLSELAKDRDQLGSRP
ncbi:MAG TPA: phage holin family protein [Acidiferrobacterales bacterium]|nr:phage holin family protein [Acidiferrobacterales bacterium]